MRSRAADNRTGKLNRPIMAVIKKAQIVSGNLEKLIPSVRILITVVI